jgi:hypothetical protein
MAALTARAVEELSLPPRCSAMTRILLMRVSGALCML